MCSEATGGHVAPIGTRRGIVKRTFDIKLRTTVGRGNTGKANENDGEEFSGAARSLSPRVLNPTQTSVE